ncbi:MAG TPA: FG-GAP-like repeat-containing protein [Candidatus Aquilonibacter sp.]|jgi:hypothetical protein|nr:FG-GAP-like repeat-containing protein [Candidatus Aquilonibacter sp.]
MKKLSTIFVFLLWASLQVFASQNIPSQFSAQTAKQKSALQAALSARANTGRVPANVAGKVHAQQSHRYTSGSNLPATTIGFVGGSDIPAGGGAQWPAVAADFNGDGNLDMAAPVLNADGSVSVAVVLSNGNGTFQAPILTANPNGSKSDHIFVGDVNGDGIQDLMVIHPDKPSTFEVWLGNGNGTFNVQSNAVNPISANQVYGGALVEANGKLNLMVIDDQTPANLLTLFGNGNGTFIEPPAIVPLSGGSLSNIVFADFNGDGIMDFAAVDSTTGQNVVFLSQSSGPYLATPLTNPDANYDICNNSVGDLNGKPDLVTVNCNTLLASSIFGPGNITVYVNNGDGTFATGVYYSVGTESVTNTNADVFPLAVVVADVNGDGKMDIVSSNVNGGDVTILLGNGDGTVNTPTAGYSTGGFPRTSALVADFNGDGFADIIVPDENFSFAFLQGYGDGTFQAAQDFFSPVSDNNWAYATTIASGDFNGDGYPDLVVGNTRDLKIGVTVYLANPDGSLRPGVNYGSGGGLEGVVTADFNADGKLDFAAVDFNNNGTGDVQVYYGNGDGTFTEGTPYPTGSNGAYTLITADFNKDGHPDLAVLNTNNDNVSILLNDGTGGFLAPVTYPVTADAQAIATADVNGDGVLDLVVTGRSSTGAISVLLGNANGTFQSASTTTFAFNYLGNLALGDLDGDGKVDLAVAVDDATASEGLAVAKGNGDGTFGTPVFYATTLQNVAIAQPLPGDVKMIDLNRDGHLDVVYSNSQYGTIGVLYNTGTNPYSAGMFYAPVEFTGGSDALSIALADINQDGAVDVMIANNNFAGVTVLLNNSGSVNTLTSSLNPATAGKSVTLTATVATKVRGVTAVPTGTVTFMDGSTSLGTANLTNGSATFTTSSLAVGSHSVTAQYSGNGNFVPTTSTVVTEVVAGVPDYALSANTTSATVNPGGSASFTITLTPAYGYNGTVSLSCGTLPATVTCSFQPASLVSPASGTVATMLTITTVGATTALDMPERLNSKPGVPMLLASLNGFGVFGLVLAGAKKRNRRYMVVVLCILALVMMFTMVGCGGSSGGTTSTSPTNPGNPGTPAGSYPVTVTGTGTGALTHTMNLTLVVK